jgi:hypothetical protein
MAVSCNCAFVGAKINRALAAGIHFNNASKRIKIKSQAWVGATLRGASGGVQQ